MGGGHEGWVGGGGGSLWVGVWWLGDMRVSEMVEVVRVCIRGRSVLTGMNKESSGNMFCYN